MQSVLFGLSVFQDNLYHLLYKARVINFPVPPLRIRLGIGGRTAKAYFVNGIFSYLPIMLTAQIHGVDLRRDGNIKVLDFGCGVGKQILHFTRSCPKASYFGCDVNERAIDFLKRHYEDVSLHANRSAPPLRFENGYFDLVYSISVFTHLSIEDTDLWMKELHRITREGGLCILSVFGHHGLENLMASRPNQYVGDCPKSLRDDGYLFYDFPQGTLPRVLQARDIEGSYGITILDEGYIRKHWPPIGFEILQYLEGAVSDIQDLVVLRKI